MDTILRDCKFYLELDTLPSAEVIEPLLQVIDKCGGQHVPNLEACTHAVLWHRQQAAYQMATSADKMVVSPVWVYACVEAKRLLLSTPQVYQPFPENGIPGAEAMLGCISSFAGPLRFAAITLIACMGVPVTKSLTPNMNTHLIARSVHEESAKVKAARQSRMHVLNLGWPLDCLQQWRLLPEEDYIQDAPNISLVVSAEPPVEDHCVPDSSDEAEPQAAGRAGAAGAHSTPQQGGQSTTAGGSGKIATVPLSTLPNSFDGRTAGQQVQQQQRQQEGDSRTGLLSGGPDAVPTTTATVGGRVGPEGHLSAGATPHARLNSSGQSRGAPATSFSREYNEPSQAMAAVGRFAQEMDISLDTGEPASALMPSHQPPIAVPDLHAPVEDHAAGLFSGVAADAPKEASNREVKMADEVPPMEVPCNLDTRTPKAGAAGPGSDATDAMEATPPCSPPRIATTVIMDEDPVGSGDHMEHSRHQLADDATSPPKPAPGYSAPSEQPAAANGRMGDVGGEQQLPAQQPEVDPLQGTASGPAGAPVQAGAPGGSTAAVQAPSRAGSMRRSPSPLPAGRETSPGGTLLAGPVAQLHVRTRAASRSRSATPDTGGSGSGRRSRRKTAAPERAMFSQYLPEGNEKELRAIARAQQREQRLEAQHGREAGEEVAGGRGGGRGSVRGRGRGRGRGRRRDGVAEGSQRAGTPEVEQVAAEQGTGCALVPSVQEGLGAGDGGQVAAAEEGVQPVSGGALDHHAGSRLDGVCTNAAGGVEQQGKAGMTPGDTPGTDPCGGADLEAAVAEGVPKQLSPIFEGGTSSFLSSTEDDSDDNEAGGSHVALPFMSCREDLPQEVPPPSPPISQGLVEHPRDTLPSSRDREGDHAPGAAPSDAPAAPLNVPEVGAECASGGVAPVVGGAGAGRRVVKRRGGRQHRVGREQAAQGIPPTAGGSPQAEQPGSGADGTDALQEAQLPTASQARRSGRSRSAAATPPAASDATATVDVQGRGSKGGAVARSGGTARGGRRAAAAAGRTSTGEDPSAATAEPAAPSVPTRKRGGRQAAAQASSGELGAEAGKEEAAVPRSTRQARGKSGRSGAGAEANGDDGGGRPAAHFAGEPPQQSEGAKQPASRGKGGTRARVAAGSGDRGGDGGEGAAPEKSSSGKGRSAGTAAARSGGKASAYGAEPRAAGGKRPKKSSLVDAAQGQGEEGAAQPSAKRQRKGSKPSNAAQQGGSHPEEGLCLALSGFRSHEQQKLQRHLQKLKVPCIIGKESHDWDPSVTHVVAPDMKRTQKCLAGLAAGVWIVGKQYVIDSAKAGQLLPPEEYELFEGVVGLVETGVAKHWRQRRECVGRGAFEGLTILLYHQVDPPATNEDIAAIIKAGNGNVINRKPGSKDTLDIVVASSSATENDSTLQAFIDGGALCVSSNYIVEWLAKPLERLTHNVLLDSLEGLEGAKVWVAERERGSVTGEEVELMAPPSPSY